MVCSRAVLGSGSFAALLLLFFLTVFSFVPGISPARLADGQLHPSIHSFNTINPALKFARTPSDTPPCLSQSDVPAVRIGGPYTDDLCQTPSAAPWFYLQLAPPGVPHNRISIQSDSDFVNQALAEGWLGNGTAVNPYIIEEYYFNCTDIGIPCIEITRTAVHFTIRHCTLLGGPSPYGAISLVEVSNGYLFNNTCVSLGRGIIISNSTLITVANCNCSSRGPDIGLGYSTQVTLFNNTCFGDPTYADWSNIYLVESTQNKVLNNTCFSTMGNIELYTSGDNTVANNTLYGGGFRYREFEGLGEHRQTLVKDNTVNGKPLLFWQDQVGGTLPGGFGQAVLVNCSQVTVSNTTVTGASVGILLIYCNETMLVNIRCEHNMHGLVLYGGSNNVAIESTFFSNGDLAGGSGVSITNSSYNVVGNNTFIDNGYGIILSGDYNTLWNNTCRGSICGIEVLTANHNVIGGSWITGNAFGLHFSYPGAVGNLIENNIFSGNNEEAVDQYENQNVYDYNYWSSYYGPDEDCDGLGDNPYYVAGSNSTYDYRPLMVPPGWPVCWLEAPTDQYFASGSYIWYDLEATASPPGISQWWLSDLILFAIDQYGVITNRVVVPPGVYWVQAWVSDWMGNVITASFKIIIYDGTTTTTTLEIPVIALIIATVAVISTAAFVSIVGIVLLRERRPIGPAPAEPFKDTRPPVDQWNARCSLCGSHLFGDEGYCPGCGNRVTRTRQR